MHKFRLDVLGEDPSRLWNALQSPAFADPDITLSREGGRPAPGTFALTNEEITLLVAGLTALSKIIPPLLAWLAPREKVQIRVRHVPSGTEATLSGNMTEKEALNALNEIIDAIQRPGDRGEHPPKLPPA